jgi:pimeloyl-ACP methyl ester carboxylesterase
MVIDLKKAASLIGGARLDVVADAGHLVPMEKPADVLELIENFLGQEGT